MVYRYTKDLYKTNKKYREALKKRAIRYYYRNRVLQKRKIECKFHVKEKCIFIETDDGRQYESCSLLQMALKLNRTEKALSYYVMKGIIPRSPFMYGRTRLYTKEMVEAVRLAIKDQGYVYILNLEKLKHKIHMRWPFDQHEGVEDGD